MLEQTVEPVLEQTVEPVLEQQHMEVEPVLEHSSEIEPDEIINEVLGDDPTKVNKYGAIIHNDIASRWEHITIEGLQKDTKTDLLKTALIPENCKFLEAPVKNPEIIAAIPDTVLKRDNALATQQNLLGQATACVAVALNSMIKDNKNKEVTKIISNAGRIMCELFHMHSSARRSLIQFSLNKETKDIVQQTKIGTQLFGDNLGDALRAGKAITKTGSEIRYSKPPPNKTNSNQKQSLNYRGPPRKPQQQRPPAPSAGRATNTKHVNKHVPRGPPPQRTQRYRR